MLSQNEIKIQKYPVSQGCCWPTENICDGVPFVWRNVPSHPRGSFRKNIWIIKQSSKQQLPDEEYKLSSCEFRTVSGRATFKFFFSPFSYKIRRGEKSNQIELISTKICFYEWFNMAKNTHKSTPPTRKEVFSIYQVCLDHKIEAFIYVSVDQ